MLDRLSAFVAELRRSGLPVSLTEHLDAAVALHRVPMTDRRALKCALAATLVKSVSHEPGFDTLFEIFFPSGSPLGSPLGSARGGAPGAGSGGEENGGGSALSDQELAQLAYRFLATGEDALASLVARQAVIRYAGIGGGSLVGAGYYLYRTLRMLDLDGVASRVVAPAHGSAGGRAGVTPLEDRLVRDEHRGRVDMLRKAVEDEIRRVLLGQRGIEACVEASRRRLPEDVDLMRSTREELGELERALRPLSRKLAARLARHRHHGRHGRLDFRSTLRSSLSYGGAPVDPRFRRRRPTKPEIVVLADVSGSVASFAHFTLHLVHAVSSQFAKVRSFVFVDQIEEVTRFFGGAEDPATALRRIHNEAGMMPVAVDGHSDYGQALTTFWGRWGDQVGPRTTVLVLGDARNNYHLPASWVLDEVQRKARHLYWLNPEPRDYWGSGDSVVAEYSPHCDAVVECRTLRQLEQFVGALV